MTAEEQAAYDQWLYEEDRRRTEEAAYEEAMWQEQYEQQLQDEAELLKEDDEQAVRSE